MYRAVPRLVIKSRPDALLPEATRLLVVRLDQRLMDRHGWIESSRCWCLVISFFFSLSLLKLCIPPHALKGPGGAYLWAGLQFAATSLGVCLNLSCLYSCQKDFATSYREDPNCFCGGMHLGCQLCWFWLRQLLLYGLSLSLCMTILFRSCF